jgi:CRP/FNR family transcriptional regulator, polysaccharide utilization system transcription regulator
MSETVLLIEDNDAIRDNSSEILELAGYSVIKARNGKEGLELARKQKPVIILCDIMMPDLDGYGVLRAVGNIPELKGTPFVFVTAKSEKQDFRYGMGLGADDYLTKPFSGEDLLSIVETRIKKARLLRESLKPDLNALEKFLQDGSPESTRPMLEQLIYKKAPKKEMLFVEGDPSNFIYYLASGKMKLFKTNELGKEYISRIYGQGEFFGYHALLDDGVHQESAEALDDSEVGMISKNDFLQVLAANPEIALKFIKNLSADYSEVKENLLKLAYNSARKRVAEALVYLAEKYATENPGPVQFSASRNDLSALSGIAPESVSRNLTDFKDEGLIEVQNSIIRILDLQKLRRLKN